MKRPTLFPKNRQFDTTAISKPLHIQGNFCILYGFFTYVRAGAVIYLAIPVLINTYKKNDPASFIQLPAGKKSIIEQYIFCFTRL